ncbi:putative MFS family arabinose efflux permease [Saccharomonospora amisosensis]|uniref:Putative MFS family arabinose efflux permease n=1 Tax=Saccharomonospora amisosensis TaxID=1128677 RepID=A0A7X5USJ8_9PSEU|nr:hypothetical protein [Saccharomonospora amisosensis]NIJ12959.1 putative MFS family arabinose efflux permease [Saccharomonospora amisosensis]
MAADFTVRPCNVARTARPRSGSTPGEIGIGSFLGVRIAGRLSDQRPGQLIAACGLLALLGWITLAALANRPVALLVLVPVQGAFSFALGSTLIARVIYEASGAPTMGGSYATAALNLGAAGGPNIEGRQRLIERWPDPTDHPRRR